MNEEIRQIETELKQLEVEISKTATEFRAENKLSANAKAKFEIAQANALLLIHDHETQTGDKLTEAVRKAKALKTCGDDYMTYRIAEATADASKEVLRSKLSELSSTQTRAKLIQVEMDLTRYK